MLQIIKTHKRRISILSARPDPAIPASQPAEDLHLRPQGRRDRRSDTTCC